MGTLLRSRRVALVLSISSLVAMLQGLLEVEGGSAAFPFVRQSYGSASTHWWDDDEWVTHELVQGEGGEQGDLLMPALYALGQHRALVAVSDQLLPTERLLAFLDDLFVLCNPHRVANVQQALWEHFRISAHQEKTQIWNRAGEAPKRWRALTAAAPLVETEAAVWRNDPSMPPSAQGVKVLGTPLGHPDSVQAHFRSSTEAQRYLPSLFCTRRGCCCSFARDPDQTICSGWCHQTWRLISLLSMILPRRVASAISWDAKCQTHLGKWPICLSRSDVWACGTHND